MAEEGPQGEPQDADPVSPELAMIDPELARRHALMPAVWETVRVAQQAARESFEQEEATPAEPRRRRRRLLLLVVAAVVAGAGAVAAFALGVFSNDSRPTSQVAPPLPAAKHPAAKQSKAPPPKPKPTPVKPKPRTTPAISKPHPAQPKPKPKPAPVKPKPQTTPAIAKPQPAPVKPKPQTTPAIAKPHVTSTPQVPPQPKPNVPRHVAPAPFTPGPKTFVWTQVAGATGYRIAFYRGTRVILVRRTQAPRLIVPGKWRYGGKVETLAPGRYQWYVWSLDSRGRPSARTVVSSTIVIGR